jgi:ribonucleoside-diphosphate reductase alpha chain
LRGNMLNDNIRTLLEQRYLKPGETWDDLVIRVVDNVCEGEYDEHKKKMYTFMYERIFLPNTPCLANAGTKNSGLMACFVVGPDEDTLENHFETLLDIASVGKRGGGCGFSGANIREHNATVAGSAHGYAYGPNNYAMRVSEALNMITQGGIRKMALMYSIPSEHPDLDDFLDLKQNGHLGETAHELSLIVRDALEDELDLTNSNRVEVRKKILEYLEEHDEHRGYNFNQSVFASDMWMRKAKTPLTKEHKQFLRLVENAWNNGEPGLLFADTINDKTPYKTCGCEILTTNPCGEQPLPSFGSCNLGSINISHDYFFLDGYFDFHLLGHVVRHATRFLDNVGSKNIFPNGKFQDWYFDHRPIGIGIMGFADCLLRMGIEYGSDESIAFLEEIMIVLQDESYAESELLGIEKGIPEHCAAVGRRNITTVSIAPTGSISLIADCSSSIEPIFSPVFNRTDERGEIYSFEHPYADKPHFRSTLNTDKNKIPSWRQHIDIQAAAQRYTDSAVSKTINMLNGVGKADIKEAFLYAWNSGCKGVTIYRDGSRNVQVLDDVTEEDASKQECPTGVCEI